MAEIYLADPEWNTLETAVSHGRPIQAWKKRLRHVLDLLDLSPRRTDLDLIVQGDRRISFAAFHEGLEAAASRLANLGVARGDKVLLILYNSPEVLLLQWGAFRLGAIPVFGNRWWTSREAIEVIGRITPQLIVTDLPLDEAQWEGGEVLSPSDIADWWTPQLKAAPVPDPRDGADEDELAAIVFTAGSTGAPKGVQLSHRNLIWSQQTFHNIAGGRAAIPDTPDRQRVSLMTTPMFHNGAIVTGISNLIDGNRMVLTQGKFQPAEVLSLIEKERVTAWQAVPTMFSRVLQHPEFEAFDLSSLVSPASGGMHVSVKLLETVQTKIPSAAATFAAGYGMTENAFITLAMLPQMLATGGAVGRPIPGAEVRIDAADETGQGEILVRSGALMIGYYGAASQPIDAEGWYRTGDLGRFDDDGLLHVTGRVNDMIIRGGENISCAHVEAALLEHPALLEAAVIGIPDEELGELVAAFIRSRPGAALSEEDIANFARTRLAYFCLPSRWVFVDDPLPVLATGKIDRLSLKNALGHLSPPSDHLLQTAVLPR